MTKEMTDRELLIKLKREEPDLHEAFDCFYMRHSDRIFRYARSQHLSQELAQEAVQSVFWKIFDKRQDYNPTYEALQWLFVIARSEIRDFRNKEKTQTKGRFSDSDLILSQTQDPNPNQDEASDLDSFQLLIADLDPETRDLLVKRFIEDLSFRELSQHFAESEASLRQKVSRAIRKLRKGEVS